MSPDGSRRPPAGWGSLGSPATVADQMEAFMETTGVDGFNVTTAPVPWGFSQVVDLLVPEAPAAWPVPHRLRGHDLPGELLRRRPTPPAPHLPPPALIRFVGVEPQLPDELAPDHWTPPPPTTFHP